MTAMLAAAFLWSVVVPWSTTFFTASAQTVLLLDSTSFRETISQDSLTLVSFQAPWCGHCTSMVPELKKTAVNLYKEKINVRAVSSRQQ